MVTDKKKRRKANSFTAAKLTESKLSWFNLSLLYYIVQHDATYNADILGDTDEYFSLL